MNEMKRVVLVCVNQRTGFNLHRRSDAAEWAMEHRPRVFPIPCRYWDGCSNEKNSGKERRFDLKMCCSRANSVLRGNGSQVGRLTDESSCDHAAT